MGRRYLTLDAMRGVAAIVVVLYHSAVVTDAACFQATCNVRSGFLAVDLFFALSGFVLSHSYDRPLENGLGIWAFMKKRFLRLMPIYWLAMAAGLPLAAWEVAKGAQSVDGLLGTAVLNAAILPSLIATSHPNVVSILRPAWSLFFEVWVANLIFALFWRQLRGAGLAAMIGGSLVGVVIATQRHGSLDLGPVWETFAGGFPRVLFSFFVGVALRRLTARAAPPRLPSLLVVGTAVATFFAPAPRGWEPVFELACVTLVYPALIYAGAGATERHARLATLLGNASYALYLIHMPLLDAWERGMRKAGVAPSPLAAGLYVVAAVLLALLIDAFYDRRARRVLAALFNPPAADPSQRPQDAAAAATAAPVSAGVPQGWAPNPSGAITAHPDGI